MTFLRLFKSGLKTYSFSYFIPAPPQRDSGYQEIELDRIVESISKVNSITLKDIRTQSCSGERAGMWAIILYRATLKSHLQLKERLLKENESLLSINEPTVDGIYYGDHE